MKNLQNSEKLGPTALFWVAKATSAAKEKQKHLPGLSSHPSRECKLSLTDYHLFAVKRDAPIHTFKKMWARGVTPYNAIYKIYSEVMELCVYTFLQHVSVCSSCFLVTLKYGYPPVFKFNAGI